MVICEVVQSIIKFIEKYSMKTRIINLKMEDYMLLIKYFELENNMKMI